MTVSFSGSSSAPLWDLSPPETAITIFAATQLVALGVYGYRRWKDRQRLVRGIFAEIVFNAEGLRKSGADSESISNVISQIRADKNFRPHVTFAVHTTFYEGNIDELLSLKSEIFPMVLAFYNDMQTLRADVAGFNSPSFAAISHAGRETVCRRYYTQLNASAERGFRAVVAMFDAYPTTLADFKLPADEGFGRASSRSTLDSSLQIYVASLRANVKNARK